MLLHNRKMQDFLKANGIIARAKYIQNGSLTHCWNLYGKGQYWNNELREKLTKLGFTAFDEKPLHKYSGNGGLFSVFVRGHYEFLSN